MAEIFTYDYGTIFEITVKEGNSNIVDVSQATEISFVFTRPNGSIVKKVGSKKTDGTDGVIQATIEQGDLANKGNWTLQITLTFPYGQWRTTYIPLTVSA